VCSPARLIIRRISKDETGGRRFWPVLCTNIDIESLARDRDHLWAEAVTRYRAGEPWWLDSMELTQLAEEEQSDRYEADPWEGLIAEWMEGRADISIEQILTVCIEKKKDLWAHSDKMRIARCLRALGWERFRYGGRASREWRYRRKVSQL
jgi:putative DNA primase/helicase